jgi:hypothetical protein
MSAITLYQLADEYRAGLEALADLDLDPQTLADTIESMGGDLELKAQNVAMFIRNSEAMIGAMREAEKAMTARRKTAEDKVEGLRNYLKVQMERCGITKIESPVMRLAIRSNPGAVIVDDEAQVPEFFWRTPPPAPPPVRTIDKTLIKQAIADGQEVPGAHVERGTRLEIKP